MSSAVDPADPAGLSLEPAAIPDLLHPQPTWSISYDATDLALGLAFAGGTSGGLFSDALKTAKIAPSTWDPASFAGDLFLESFVASCFDVKLGHESATLNRSYLARLLAHPPTDPAIVDHRRQIVAELISSSELHAELLHLYRSLGRLRSLLEGTTGAAKWDANRRQLDVLAHVKTIIERMATSFRGARSGLARLSAYAEHVQHSEPFTSLVDLLRYDEQCATLTLLAGMGADGRIRSFQVQSVQENQANPFMGSPLRRWLSKLEMFARGFRFSDGEVMARLLDAVYEGVRGVFVGMVQLLGDLEFYLGAMGFHQKAKAAGLDVCLPHACDPSEPRTLIGLFNPLLLGHGVSPVPCNLVTDRHDTTVLITGPNSGGKTRLLQAVGLCQLLAQVGLFVPAREARLAFVPGLVMSLIQETQVDQAEGRLGVELVRIRALFEKMPPQAMVILDELCSGTNPSEGEEIFELVVGMLTRLRPQAFITTHFLGFAARLQREAKIRDLRFLRVLLDPSQQPTYQFAEGVADSSLAAHTAARLGVTGEQLQALIEAKVRSLDSGRR